jgi:hypothetical protein
MTKGQNFCHAYLAWVLMFFSQTKEKGDKQTLVSPAASKSVAPQESRFSTFLECAQYGLLGAGVVFVFLVLPAVMDQRWPWLRLQKQKPSVQGPDVLGELLGEVRLLRLAVEKLAGQG